MTTPVKPWESNSLQNSTQIQRNTSNVRDNISPVRSAPVLPPLPRSSAAISSGYNSVMPYSNGYGGLGYGSYGSGYGSYGMPYRNSLYNSYGSYGGYSSMYGMGGMGGGAYPGDDSERRFIQYAEESSRNTFASVESIVRAFNSISMMLDNTFFAMTSSFRAVLSVAENFGKLRSMFGHIWHSINIFRLFTWLYRKMMGLMGRKVPNSATSLAWKQAATGAGAAPAPGSSPGTSWPTLAFLGVLVSAPYIISKFLPKYEDKCHPDHWKSRGISAKAAFDFVGRSQNELTFQTNDKVILAPTYVQEELNLKNTGWAYALCNGNVGMVPLNYLVIKSSNYKTIQSKLEPPNQSSEIPIPRVMSNGNSSNKSHTKRVSFGENQIFENVDLEDYVSGKKQIKDEKENVKNEENIRNQLEKQIEPKLEPTNASPVSEDL